MGFVEEFHLYVGAVDNCFEIVLYGELFIVIVHEVVLADQYFFVWVLFDAFEKVLLKAVFFLL